MKPEEKYLNQLFEIAREEDPHTSLETVSDTFLSATSPRGFAFVKELFWKNFSLNSVIIIAVGTIYIFCISLLLPSSSTISKNKISPPTVTSLPLESSVKKEKNFTDVKSEVADIPQEKKHQETVSYSISKNETDIKFQKTTIPSSPKIRFTSPLLETHNNEFTTTIKVKSMATVETAKVITTPKHYSNKTHISPWVASGSGGTTHVDWSIEQSQQVKNVTNDERVLQKIMNAEYLKTIIAKDDNGNFSPLTMVSNNFFDQKVYIEFNEKPIQILVHKPTEDKHFINIKKYKLKKKKAYLEFDYNGENIKIQLKKVNYIWKYHKLKATNNSGKKINITF